MSTFKHALAVLPLVLAGCAAAPESAADGDNTEQALTSFVCSDHVEGEANEGEEQGVGVVSAARAGGHPGFDRFVLEFTRGNVPHWYVSRSDSATFGMDGSGDPVPLPGTAGLYVAVQSSMYYDGWSSPEGGYFVTLRVPDGCASEVVRLAKEAGIALTPAGATHPYGKDPDDAVIRLAPTFPVLDEVEKAMAGVAVCVNLALAQR